MAEQLRKLREESLMGNFYNEDFDLEINLEIDHIPEIRHETRESRNLKGSIKVLFCRAFITTYEMG